MNLFAYWNSDRLVLSMHGATEVDAHSAPELYQMFMNWRSCGLPVPRVYLMDEPQPNAFATVRVSGARAVAVTPAFSIFSSAIVRGVIAHELAHIRTATADLTITATIAGAISMLAQFACSSAVATAEQRFGVIGTRRW